MTPTDRFLFHFRPHRGWVNDPNGLIEWHGVHHLFFQHKPDWPHSDSLHWGHATSTDLISWTEQPIALTPGDSGDYDDGGCLSGCAVVTAEDCVAILYTAQHDGRQLPALATSTDPGLDTWTKSWANPVIPRLPPLTGLTDMRDHAVVREGPRWRQVLAAGRDRTRNGTRAPDEPPEGDGRGGLLVSYLSSGDDLADWTFDGVLLDGGEADLPGEVWECPDVSSPPGTEPGTALVILSWYTHDSTAVSGIRSDAIWLIGRLARGRFSPERYGRLDLGDRLYAPQSYGTSDDRRLLRGWVRINDQPQAIERGWLGTITLPRELEVIDSRLHQRPCREIDRLPWRLVGTLTDASPTLSPTSPATGLDLRIDCHEPSDLPHTRLTFIDHTGAAAELSLDFLVPARSWTRTTSGWQPDRPSATSVRVIFDTGLIELFANDGSAGTTSRLQISEVAQIQLTARPGLRVEAFQMTLPADRTGS